MATVTTAIPLVASSRSFASPATRTGSKSAAPIQRMIFTAVATIALKDAANESLVIWTATLPAKFYYRIASMRIAVQSVALAEFSDWEPMMSALVTENQASVYQFALWNECQFYLAGGQESVKIDQDSVTNDFGTFFSPQGPVQPSQYLIDASKGTSIVQIKWVDSSSDATAATGSQARLEIDQFRTPNANQAPLNTSVLVY